MIKFGFWISETYSISVSTSQNLSHPISLRSHWKWDFLEVNLHWDENRTIWLVEKRPETMGNHLCETDYWNWLVWNNEFNFYWLESGSLFNSPRQNKVFSAIIQILVSNQNKGLLPTLLVALALVNIRLKQSILSTSIEGFLTPCHQFDPWWLNHIFVVFYNSWWIVYES